VPSSLKRLGFLDGFLDAADHVERLLGQVIVLARDDRLEAADGVASGTILPSWPVNTSRR